METGPEISGQLNEEQKKTRFGSIEKTYYGVGCLGEGLESTNQPLRERELSEAEHGERDYVGTVYLPVSEEVENVNDKSKNGIEIGVTEVVGQRKTQEDCVSFGVLDGFNQLSAAEKKEVLKESVKKLQADIVSKLAEKSVENGSCYISVVTEQALEAPNKFTLHTTTVGDSLAFFVRVNVVDGTATATRLNQTLHNPEGDEIERIEKNGGFVAKKPDGTMRLNGQSAVSRSLGDRHADGTYCSMYSFGEVPSDLKDWFQKKFGNDSITGVKNGYLILNIENLKTKQGIEIDEERKTVSFAIGGLSHEPDVYADEFELKYGEVGYLVMACDGLQERQAVSDEAIAKIIAQAHYLY